MNAPNIPYTHGQYVGGKETSTHAIWRGMMARCHTPTSKDYGRYGKRGVRVCRRWHVFENFLADMGERPTGKQLDRFPNTSGNYEAENCRWATHSEQQINKRNTRYYWWQGERLPASQFAERLGISRALLSYRLKQGRYADARV